MNKNIKKPLKTIIIEDKKTLKVINIDSIEENKKMLASNKKFKTVFFNFTEGNGLPNHKHNGYAAIQVYEGVVDMEFVTGEKFQLKKGDFMEFDARVEHNVIAKVDSKILVIISEALV
ncbi:MAG: cupin domain-containing protein [Clostridium sp.]|uniref:cupin domain-containing protein n=1 Tax=Clostridium sp. TaxID=1506 RepID=UPI00306AC7B7